MMMIRQCSEYTRIVCYSALKQFQISKVKEIYVTGYS